MGAKSFRYCDMLGAGGTEALVAGATGGGGTWVAWDCIVARRRRASTSSGVNGFGRIMAGGARDGRLAGGVPGAGVGDVANRPGGGADGAGGGILFASVTVTFSVL